MHSRQSITDGKVKDAKRRAVGEFGIRENIWTYHAGNNGDGDFKHPAKFPLALAHDHIRSWSNDGDTVFDPFMGSGTTGVAAKELGRNFIGIEKVEKYYEIASERIFL